MNQEPVPRSVVIFQFVVAIALIALFYGSYRTNQVLIDFTTSTKTHSVEPTTTNDCAMIIGKIKDYLAHSPLTEDEDALFSSQVLGAYSTLDCDTKWARDFAPFPSMEAGNYEQGLYLNIDEYEDQLPGSAYYESVIRPKEEESYLDWEKRIIASALEQAND